MVEIECADLYSFCHCGMHMCAHEHMIRETDQRDRSQAIASQQV